MASEQGFCPGEFLEALRSLHKDPSFLTISSVQILIEQISKIIRLLGGSALSFVESDLELKMNQIKEAVQHREEQAKLNGLPTEGSEFSFYYVNTAMEIEKIESGPKPFSNAFLRQRRTVEFISKMLQKLDENQQSTLREAVRDAYSETLSEIHPWFIRGAVSVGIYGLPLKETFLVQIGVPHDQEKEKLQEILSHLAPLVKNMYDLFKEHEIGHWK